jgi:hypothetical protein
MPLRLVELADLSIYVGEEPEGEQVPFGEAVVVVLGVERDAQDFGVQFLELGGSVTEPLSLDPSPGGVGYHVPPQHHPPTAEVGQGQLGAVVRR